MLRHLSLLLAALMLSASTAEAQSYELTFVDIPGGTFTMGEPESSHLGPPGSWDSPEHTVTLGNFRMSETEVTNAQYVSFLNAALAAGLVEVRVNDATMGPDVGATLVYGTATAPVEYAGIAMLNLSGTRVMKDHLDDGDGDPFTGVIQPENPLNISYIGYDEGRATGDFFYVKDPRDASDFDWQALTDYYNYTSVSRQLDTSVLLNDYADWPELADYPNNLPTQAEVANWPASFVRWYGAKAFALFYDYDLPTEAEWEYAGKGGADYIYATHDGAVAGDGSSAVWNHLLANPALGHVQDVKVGTANPYGLYNMAGNVWEWMEDWYDAGFYADATDPVNTSDTGRKVRRGGSWNYHEATLKTAARGADEQFKGNDHFGFRVVSRADVSTSSRYLDELARPEALVEVYPNPLSRSTTLRFPSNGSAVIVRVFDLLGREVLRTDSAASTAGSQELRLDMGDFPPGLYVFQVTSSSFVKSGTLVLGAR